MNVCVRVFTCVYVGLFVYVRVCTCVYVATSDLQSLLIVNKSLLLFFLNGGPL